MDKREQQRIQFFLSLISPKLTSVKRIKLMDELETIRGYDLVFILCLLIRNKYSGILNIATESNELSSITLIYGDIVKVDYPDPENILGSVIVESEIISKYEMDEIFEKASGQRLGDYLLENKHLTELQLRKILFKQSRDRLTKYINEKNIRINFTFDGQSNNSTLISSANFFEILHKWIFEDYRFEWLSTYCEYYSKNILQVNFKNDAYVIMKEFPELQQLSESLQLTVEKKLTFDQAFKNSNMPEGEFSRAIHYMVLTGFILIRKNASYNEMIQSTATTDETKLSKDLAAAKVLMLNKKYFEAFGILIKYSSISHSNEKVKFYTIWVKLIGAFYNKHLLDVGGVSKKLAEIDMFKIDPAEYYYVKSLLAATQKNFQESDEFFLKAIGYDKVYKKFPINENSSFLGLIKKVFQ